MIRLIPEHSKQYICMISEFCQNERSPALPQTFFYIRYNLPVSHITAAHCGICFIDLPVLSCSIDQPCKSRIYIMRNSLKFHFIFCAETVSDWSDLHKYFLFLSVIPFGSCGQTISISGRDFFHYCLCGIRCTVMTFIYEYHSIILHNCINISRFSKG